MNYRLSVVEAPDPIVTWEDMKAHAKIEEEAEKAYVEGLILAATTWIDGTTGSIIGPRALGLQTLKYEAPSFSSSCGDGLRVPIFPIREIVSIAYRNPEGAEVVLPSVDYELIGTSIFPKTGSEWPQVQDRDDAVKVILKAGYDEVPAPIKVAIMITVAHWYRSREPVSIGAAVAELPFSADALLHTYKIYE